MIALPIIIMFFIGLLFGAVVFNKPLRKWAERKMLNDEEVYLFNYIKEEAKRLNISPKQYILENLDDSEIQRLMDEKQKTLKE